jgi:hypothetical protein
MLEAFSDLLDGVSAEAIAQVAALRTRLVAALERLEEVTRYTVNHPYSESDRQRFHEEGVREGVRQEAIAAHQTVSTWVEEVRKELLRLKTILMSRVGEIRVTCPAGADTVWTVVEGLGTLMDKPRPDLTS